MEWRSLGNEVLELLSESLESFSRTIEELRAENPQFFEWELAGSALETLAARASSPESSLALWQIAQAIGDEVGPKALHTIAHRLFDFGESDAGFTCLQRAYQRSSEYNYGSAMAQEYLVELCERDTDRVATFLIERCGRAFSEQYGGYDLPRMIARYFAAPAESDQLRRVFDDYLNHCEDLFASLPKDQRYAWLRDYLDDGRDEGAEIVAFLIDLIGEPEIEQGRRLVRVIADLARVRPKLVSRIACERMAEGEPMLRDRLVVLIESLAFICPAELAVHAETLTSLLTVPNFQLRMTLIKTIRAIAASVAIPGSVSASIERAERQYSPLIAYPARRFIHAEPSPAFVAFFREAVLFDLHTRIASVSKLIKVTPAIILYYIERTLLASNWSATDEAERRKEDWRYHTRDDRVVWIIPRFHAQTADIFQKFVHEAVENGRYDAATLSALENVLRSGDPAFVGTLPRVKPSDIPALQVVDGVQWLEELRHPGKRKIETLPSGEWTTIQEDRRQSQTGGHHPVFVSYHRVRSVLIAPALASQVDQLPPPHLWSDYIPVLHEQERLTIAGGQRRLIDEGSAVDFGNELLPLVSAHDNGIAFQGFRILAFPHPTWLKHFDLEFKNAEVLLNGRCVARLEEWQEGYEDEPYSRELLSSGMRLVARTDWLQEILKGNERALIIHTEEARSWFKDSWKSEPTAQSSRETTTCFVRQS